MRKDMKSVLVERSRRGGNNDRIGRKPRDMDDYPKKQSMKKMHSDRKSLNENLNPLKRFLESKVGQHWDSVFSEICEGLKLTSAVQKHVRDHVFDYVHLNVFIEDKKVLVLRKYYGTQTELRNGEMYVDPKTKVLKKYKVKNKTRNKYDPFLQHLAVIIVNHSRIIIEGDKTYKLFFDKLTDDFTIKHEATAKHAEADFNHASFNNLVAGFFSKYSNCLNFKHPYWKSYWNLYQKRLAEDSKKKEKDHSLTLYKVGETVEFSKDDGKTYTKGVINRVNVPGVNFHVYWITVGTKNISLYMDREICKSNRIRSVA